MYFVALMWPVNFVPLINLLQKVVVREAAGSSGHFSIKFSFTKDDFVWIINEVT